jgi:hypothetical protein
VARRDDEASVVRAHLGVDVDRDLNALKARLRAAFAKDLVGAVRDPEPRGDRTDTRVDLAEKRSLGEFGGDGEPFC